MYHFNIFVLAVFLSFNVGWGISCPESLRKIALVTKPSFTDLFSELQKVDPQGKTKLALQSDFGPYIDPKGGGACASSTAFNMLQGLRVMSQQENLNPKPVLEGAFLAIPELLAGRVTNTQMTKLLNYLGKYLPNHSLEISAERSIQSKPSEGEIPLKVWTKFDGKQLETNSNELKMVVFQVHDRDKKLLGRHFVVLKKKLSEDQIVVIDPHNPAKEFTYELTQLQVAEETEPVTRLARPDKVPHKSGWIFTLDTIFSVKLNSK